MRPESRPDIPTPRQLMWCHAAKYPSDVIDFAIEAAGLRAVQESLIQIAQRACSDLQGVNFITSSFEDWSLEREAFQAVAAASAMHRVSEQTAYRKAEAALTDSGYLIQLLRTDAHPSLRSGSVAENPRPGGQAQLRHRRKATASATGFCSVGGEPGGVGRQALTGGVAQWRGSALKKRDF